MIDAFLRSFIGGVGRAFLDFYIANSLYINAIILCYALCVFLANQSYKLGLGRVRTELEKTGKKMKNRSLSELKKTLEDATFPWKQVQNSYWFPLITPSKRILLYPKTISNLKRIFSAKNLLETALKEK